MTRRVLQVLGRSAGGIAKHVSQITTALDGDAGLHIDVACPPGLPIAMPKETLALVVPDGLTGHLATIRSLRSIVVGGGYDMVHAHGLRAGVDSALAARGRCEVLATVHNLVRTEIAGRRAAIDRLTEPGVVRLTDRTLAVSREIAARLVQASPRRADKVEVLYLGIGDPPSIMRTRAELRSELGLSDHECLAAAVARLAPQKALPVMFDAIGRTRSRVVLVVLGEGPLESELRAEVGRRGLGDRIRFLGFRDDVADLVAAADLLCLSSTWEGVPLSVQEAVLLGTPVVSTDVGGMSEIVTDGRSGRLVPSGDAAALAAAIDQLCGSPQLRTELARRAKEDLPLRFSTETMLARLRSLYLEGVHA